MSPQNEDPPVLAMPRPTIRNLMIVVALFALVFAFGRLAVWIYRTRTYGPTFTPAAFSSLCKAESDFMKGQAARCRVQVSRGIPFDDDSELSQMLKVCPYVVDDRAEETWEAQALVWDRASARSIAASLEYERAGY